MDGHRFDELTRALARGTSRRAVLRGLGAALVGGATGLVAGRSSVSACTTDADCPSPSCDNGWQTTYACANNGSCHPTTVSCDPFGCNAAGSACADDCATHDDCPETSHCAEGTCVEDKGLGEPCVDGVECQFGFCATGVCCNEACAGVCQACGSDGFCSTAPNDETCAGGTCCDGECVHTASDVAHCGACDAACAGAVCQVAVCAAGVCGTEPAPDDTPCDEGRFCLDGECGCAEGLTLCGETCVDTQTDPQHCGDCATDCPEAEECQVPACVDGTCDAVPDPDAVGEACGDGPVCADGDLTTSACDAEGNCAATVTECGLYLCNAEGTACLTACQNHDECLAEAYCDEQGRCRDDKAEGDPCTGPDECASGRCVFDVCAAGCSGDFPLQCGEDCCVDFVMCCAGECCDPGQSCCGDAEVCCDEGLCCAGTCCAEGTVCCGDTCCATGEDCCGDSCCSYTCCAGTCCGPGQSCFTQSGECGCSSDEEECGDTCCIEGQVCCDGACCGPTQSCEDNQCACAPDREACGDTCCPPATTCDKDTGECLCPPVVEGSILNPRAETSAAAWAKRVVTASSAATPSQHAVRAPAAARSKYVQTGSAALAYSDRGHRR